MERIREFLRPLVSDKPLFWGLISIYVFILINSLCITTALFLYVYILFSSLR